MAKKKLQRFAENKVLPNVFEPAFSEVLSSKSPMAGKWHEYFGNSNPITLELGCGKGEYSIGLAKKYSNRNFIGVDIKGARIWRGAKTAHEEGLPNAAFLRTRVEFINRFFEPGEVSEIWLTFSDPQPKDETGRKKLSGPRFLELYKQFMPKGGLVHVKTDSPVLYEWTVDHLPKKGYEILLHNADIYGTFLEKCEEDLREILLIKTFYEERWLKEGAKIRYIRIRL